MVKILWLLFISQYREHHERKQYNPGWLFLKRKISNQNPYFWKPMLQKYHRHNIAKLVALLQKTIKQYRHGRSHQVQCNTQKSGYVFVSFLTKTLLSGMHWFRNLEMSVVQQKEILDPLGGIRRRICVR